MNTFLSHQSLLALRIPRAMLSGCPEPLLREVRADDADNFQKFVMQLSPWSRRMRFHGTINSCTPSLLKALTQPDPATHRAWVALQLVDGEESIVGEARFVASDDGRDAELAIAVADAQRGRGIADRLLETVVQAAAQASVQTLFGDVLEGNEPMFGLMRRHGFEPRIRSGLVRWRRRLAV